ncbi:MAG: hypothetical protein GEV07_24240 [Streptosporangiales bacterium]|nr:hypothetical protein [Streptosporangiales bacterium]
MQVHVDTWDPSYGTGFEATDEADSDALRDVAVELPAESWQPLTPAPECRAPRTVLFVDGVRRIDANVWLVDGDTVSAGLCASYAAGVVRCDHEARLVEHTVRRGLFTTGVVDGLEVAGTSGVRYPQHTTAKDDPDALRMAVQDQLGAAEVSVAELARTDAADDDDLLVVDGPLRGRTHLPRTLGYVKSQERRYLPPELDPVVTALRPGERTPVFLMGTRWQRHAWYLRLPGAQGPPWAGIVRIECAAEVPAADAVALADRSAVTLPRFASSEHKEPRAPQNLVPIAGLERRLRSRLGDARLLRRGLRAAAAAPALVDVGAG